MVSFSTPWRSTLFCVVFFYVFLAFLLPIFCFSAFYEWFLIMLDIDNIVCHFLHFMWAHYQDEGNSLWFLQEDVPYLKFQEFFRRNIWGQQKPWHFLGEFWLDSLWVGWRKNPKKQRPTGLWRPLPSIQTPCRGKYQSGGRGSHSSFLLERFSVGRQIESRKKLK